MSKIITNGGRCYKEKNIYTRMMRQGVRCKGFRQFLCKAGEDIRTRSVKKKRPVTRGWRESLLKTLAPGAC
jgi:hypothetical protein